MRKTDYTLLEGYMLSCMEDSAHDREHVYRVLYNALEIAAGEQDVNHDILIAACLLHDVGRKEQFENPSLCHAVVGAEKADRFLTENGFGVDFAQAVRACIETHRYRKSNPPQSVEAKILFDADKLDAAGAIGIARTLVYKGQTAEPLYSVDPDGSPLDGTNDTAPSFFREYQFKLKNIYDCFYTATGAMLAKERQAAAVCFYHAMRREILSSYKGGREALHQYLEP